MSINFWVLNITFSADLAIDMRGNVQPLVSVTKDLNASGKLSASVGETLGIYAVPDTSYLCRTTCKTYNTGAGLNVPIPQSPIAVGGSANIVATTDNYWGVTCTYGASTISASGGEWHTGIIDTYALAPQISISQIVEYLFK